MMLGNVSAVFRFEWRRAWSLGRLVWWIALTAFPVFIVGLIRFASQKNPPGDEIWLLLMFGLGPLLISMLGSFLWATTAVSNELERKSWVYLAVRPRGATAVLIGKYLVTLGWVIPSALVGLVIASFCTPDRDSAVAIIRLLAPLICLACPAYAAVYLLIGVIFPKRSMVVGVAYSFIFEVVVGFVPAVVNKLTVQYRLRSLLLHWAEGFDLREARAFKNLAGFEVSPASHVILLIAYTLGILLASVIWIRFVEFSLTEEADA